MYARFTASIVTASLITLGLLLMMQEMVASGKAALSEQQVHPWTPFIVEESDPPPVETRREPPVRNRPAEPPVVPRITDGTGSSGDIVIRRPGPPELSRPAGQSLAGPTDGDLLPIVKVQASYPRPAIVRELEGWVIVQFTVTESGSVTDAAVVESTHPIFETAAVEAALRFRYRPRIVNGEPVRVTGVQNLIRFELDSARR